MGDDPSAGTLLPTRAASRHCHSSTPPRCCLSHWRCCRQRSRQRSRGKLPTHSPSQRRPGSLQQHAKTVHNILRACTHPARRSCTMHHISSFRLLRGGVKTHELSRCPQPICVVCRVVVACQSLHSFGARCCCRVSPFALGLAGISTFACRLSWLPNGCQIAAVLETMLAFLCDIWGGGGCRSKLFIIK